MNLTFLITNHGFGHIMRNIPVIAYLLETTQDNILLITGQNQLYQAKIYLERYGKISAKEVSQRFTGIPMETDPGLILEDKSLAIDRQALEETVRAYTGSFADKVQWAREIFVAYDIDKLICDIVPWGLLAAKDYGIPSVLMASFTWIEIYEEYLSEDLIEPYRQAFDQASQVLIYDLANRPTRERFSQGIEVGIVARPFHEERVADIRKRLQGCPIVFVSIGRSNDGLDTQVDVSSLPYTFISTTGSPIYGDNVYELIPELDHTQDYVLASDYCISKAGWSTVAEILLAGKPMALIKREDVAEDRMTVAQLEERGQALPIQVSDLEDVGSIHAILDKMQKMPWSPCAYENDYRTIANYISPDHRWD